jgi:hypothetical protein
MWIENKIKKGLVYTKPGSISYLLYGEKPSEQSINIKIGLFGEFLSKELINNSNLKLLNCGIQTFNNKKKDIDLIFKNEENKTIYYRELKGNIELDTEKLPSTINKCKEIEIFLKKQYIEYNINSGILNWSIYNREILKQNTRHIKTFENNGIKIDHIEDFLKIININWDKEDYYLFFKEIGIKLKTINNS